MNSLKRTTIAALTCILSAPLTPHAQKDYGIHDPAGIVKENDRYYTFYTSNGVECASSTDLCTWRRGNRVFSTGFPSWISEYVSGFRGNFWAPAVFYMNTRWHVYYSCSSFGSRGSAIGLATSPSLSNPEWEDQGMVVFTNNASDHNAIDADIMRHDGKIWLIYGSFWSGIVMTELDTTTGKPIDREDLHYVANGNPEAAFGIHHGKYYYLFFNRGKCCSGVNSTYYINVGRSENPTGPFLDKEDISTADGGGTKILETQGRFIGPGHFGFFTENGREYMSYHYYDRNQNGFSKLKISTLSWEDGWPVVNTGFDPCNPGPIEDCAGVENGTAYFDQCGICVGGTTGNEACVRDCHGEWGGDAINDTCGICVGGNTDLLPCTGLIESEEAVEFDGAIKTVNEGYSGEGYFSFDEADGSSITWDLCADTTLTVRLVIRYTNGSTDDRNASLAINGVEQQPVLEMPPTPSWTDWKSASVNASLTKGRNRITFTSLSDEGGPNIDLISFSDNNVHPCATGIDALFHRNIPQRSDISYANGIITVEMQKSGSVGLFLYTLSGRLAASPVVKKVSAGTNRLMLNTSMTGSGIYLLIVEETNTAVRYEKFISVW